MTQNKVQVPEEHIPLVALHWGYEKWYGSKMSPLQMRRFFEPKLRNTKVSQEIINTWVKEAEDWKFLLDKNYPGLIDEKLQEYNLIKLVA